MELELGLGGRYPELVQVESGVSPVKYVLVLSCFFPPGLGFGRGRKEEPVEIARVIRA